MADFIDDDLRLDAARILARAAAKRLREFADTPVGKVVEAAAFEQRRIRQEEHREATPRDLARFALRILADDDEPPSSRPQREGNESPRTKREGDDAREIKKDAEPKR